MRNIRGAENTKYYHEYFDSLHSFSSFIETAPKTTSDDASTKEGGDRTEFTGTPTYKVADDMMKSATLWNEAHAYIEKIKAKLPTLQGKGTRITFENEFAGGSVNMGRYLQGKPDTMKRMHRTEASKRGKIVDLYFDPCLSGGIPTSQMMNYGIAVYSFVNTLEQDGYRVNLFVAATNNSKNGYQVCTIKIKDSSEPLEMNSMLYAAAHPSMFRRHIFAYLERMWYFQTGHGRVAELSRYTREQLMWHYNDNPSNSFFLFKLQELPSHVARNSQNIYDKFVKLVYQQMSDIETGKQEPFKAELHFKF
jgi:hypothetical protein